MAVIAAPEPEIIIVTDHHISCDGGGGALGHPKVWLETGKDGVVECGYCDRRFILAGSQEDPQGRHR